MMRRGQAAVLAALCVFALACEGTARTGGGKATPAPTRSPRAGTPSSMAALGDSITAGFGSCATLVACRRNSWASGSSSAVDSHYLRIRAENAEMRGNADNFAVPGVRAEALPRQADRAVRAKAQYVTILIGGNDVCRAGVGDMTSVSTFREHVDETLRRLKNGLPETRILVASIPDVYRLWELGHSDPRAVRAWGRGVCPSLLANPTSTAEVDEERRRLVRDRIEAYNDELSQACREHGEHCRYDGGRVHRVRFTLDMVNRIDYFHPTVKGQAALADATFPRRFTW